MEPTKIDIPFRLPIEKVHSPELISCERAEIILNDGYLSIHLTYEYERDKKHEKIDEDDILHQLIPKERERLRVDHHQIAKREYVGGITFFFNMVLEEYCIVIDALNMPLIVVDKTFGQDLSYKLIAWTLGKVIV